MFPKRVPMERDAPSPESMVYSFIYTCQSPQLRSSPKKKGEKTYGHRPRRPTQTEPAYNWVWHGSQKGLFTTLPSLPQCHGAFSTIPSTLAWVAQSPLSQCVIVTLKRVSPPCVTASHVTQGTNPYNPELQTRGWICVRHQNKYYDTYSLPLKPVYSISSSYKKLSTVHYK